MFDPLGTYVDFLFDAASELLQQYPAVINQSGIRRGQSIGLYGNASIVSSPITSIAFDGNGDYGMPVAYTHPGSNDCCLECFYRPIVMPTSDNWPSAWPSCHSMMGWGTPGATDGFNLVLGQTQVMAQNSDTKIAYGAHGMSVGNLYHLCAERYNGVITTYVNGVAKGNYSIGSSAVGAGSGFYIGCETGGGAWANGYMPAVRYTNGIARYKGEFTPPASFDPCDLLYVKLLPSLSSVNPLFGGNRQITTTVKRQGVPGAYVTDLLDRATKMHLARKTSNADGSLTFDGIEQRDTGYILISTDPQNDLLAGVTETFTTDPMP